MSGPNGSADPDILALVGRVSILENHRRRDRDDVTELVAKVRDIHDMCRRTNEALEVVGVNVNRLLIQVPMIARRKRSAKRRVKK